MADINDRLDRLQRREDFDRSGMPLRPAPGTEYGQPVVRPVGVDDRLGEVLDAVAAVVSKHPGLSVMIAVADGRAGRPVVRVTERDGGVETGVVVPGALAPAPAVQAFAVPSTERPHGPATLLPELAAELAPELVAERLRELLPEPADDRPGGLEPLAGRDREPADEATVRLREPAPAPAPEPVGEATMLLPGLAPEPVGEANVPLPESADEATVRFREPEREAEPQEVAAAAGRLDGRHAAVDEAGWSGAGWSGSSWHNSLWSTGAQSRFRSQESGPPPAPGHRRPEPADTDRLRVLADPQRPDSRGADPQRAETQDLEDQHPETQRAETQPDEGRRPEGQRPGVRGPGDSPAPPGGTIPLPEDTSQVVTRLAQLLRDNPALASSWGREAPE